MDYSLVDEIKQDLHNEKLETLWQKYRYGVYGLIALILLGTTAGVSYKHYTRSAQQSAGDQFYAALYDSEQGKKKEAIEGLSRLIDRETSYRGFAAIIRAELMKDLEENPQKGLAAVLEEGGLDPLMREVIALQKARYAADDGEAINVLDFPLLAYAAKEQELLQLIAQGDTQAVEKQADILLTDPLLPPMMRQRIGELKAFSLSRK